MRIPPTRASSTGFTLIELMVALVLSLLLVVAMLKVQSSLAQQTVVSSDSGVRDNEARAATNLVTQDLGNSGFLVADSQWPCTALFTYNNTTGTNTYYAHHAVDAIPATTTVTLPFAMGLTLNYPVTGSGIPSDVIAMTGSNDATDFSAAPVVLANPNGGALTYTTGVIPILANAALTSAQKFGVFQITYGVPPAPSRTACYRMPIGAIGIAPATVTADTTTNLFPGTFFAGFAPSLAAAGFQGAPSNAVMFQGHLLSMGVTPNQVTNVYYVDKSLPYPVLMRAQYSLANDALIGTPHAIAAGVVSIQALFGVDPGLTGAITAYESAATVTTSIHWDFVRSVRIAIVSRSLNDDANYTAANPLVLSNNFANISTAAFPHRRYQTNYIEMAARNTLWTTNAGIGGPP